MSFPDFGNLGIPSVDVCAICSDSECDGIGCICGLDPNDESDIPRLERLQNLVRWGLAWEQANELIAYAEGRWSPPPGDGWWDTGHTPKACDCNHHWDAHTPFRGCSVCSCKKDPPNQPPPPGEPESEKP